MLLCAIIAWIADNYWWGLFADNRSVDELLEFIESSPSGSKSTPPKKPNKKKKNKPKKEKTKDDPLRASTDSQSASESSPPTSIKLSNSGGISPTQKVLAKEAEKATEQAKDRSKMKFKQLELLQRSGGSDLSMSRDSALDSAHSIDSTNSARSTSTPQLKNSRSAMSAGDSDDSKMAEAGDLELEDDEELDPEQLAALDKEVEEFRQRLEAMNREVVRI